MVEQPSFSMEPMWGDNSTKPEPVQHPSSGSVNMTPVGQKPVVSDKEMAGRQYEGTARAEKLGETGKQALSFTGAALEQFPGAAYIPAGLAKGAGYVGIPGYEQYKDMPIVDIKNKALDIVGAAREQYPKTGYAGATTGVAGSMYALPAVSVAGPVVSSGLTGGLYSGLEGYAKNLDPTEAVQDAITGTIIGGALGPVASAASNKVGNLVERYGEKAKGLFSSDLSQSGVEAAKSYGLSPDEIKTLAPHLKEAFKKYGYTPEAVEVARAAEFGITPTRGMASKDPAQMLREAEYGTPSFSRIQEEAAAHAQNMYGVSLPNVQDAVEAAANKAIQQAHAAKTAAEGAYTEAGKFKGGFDREAITNVGDKIMQRLGADPKNLSIVKDPTAQRTAELLNDTLGTAIAATGPSGQTYNVVHRDFGAVDQGRQVLTNAYNNAIAQKDGAGQRAIKKMIDEFDDHIEQAINQGAFSGDPAVVDQWKKARGLWSEYQTKFGIKKSGEDAGNLVSQLISKEKKPEEVANMIFNFNSEGSAQTKMAAMKAISQLRRSLGSNSSEMEAIKNAYVTQLMTPKPGPQGEVTQKTFLDTAAQIDNLLQGSGRGVSRLLLTDAERQMLGRFGAIMKNAGGMSQNELSNALSKNFQMVKELTPGIVSSLTGYLGFVDPVLAGAIAAPGIIKQAMKTAPIERYRANKPFESPELPFNPKAALAPPLTVGVPERDIANQAHGGRIGRATGGKTVMNPEREADMLMRRVAAAKKIEEHNTERLLEKDDTVIAKALAKANKDI